VVRGAMQHMECDTQRIEQLCSHTRERWLALLTIRQPMQPSGCERACRQHQTPSRADSDNGHARQWSYSWQQHRTHVTGTNWRAKRMT
jgi:hypothetical protein